MAEFKNLKDKRTTFSEIDMHGRIMPQAVDFEEAVLGAMMLEQNAAGLVIDRLSKEMFYKESHQHVFQAIYEVFETGNPVDLLSVTAQLRKNKMLEAAGGAYYLALLTNKVISSANIEFHARFIAEKHIQRSLISVSTETIRDAYDDSTDIFELLNKTEQQLFDIVERNFTRNGVEMSQLMSDFLKEIKTSKDNKSELRGVPSGFTNLDRVTGGWHRSNLIILAARPGMGKTGFVLSMARNMAVEYDKPVAFFSLEMSAADLAMRLVAAETGIQIDKLQKAEISDEEINTLVNKMGVLTDAKLIIDDTPGLTVFDLRAKCRRLKQQHGIQCIVIDYLQLMSGGKENKGNREQEISTISRSLKTLAKELNIPVIALSQLNRSVETRSTTTKRPQLSDLRESGAIEQDADLVLFIYRPEYYKLAFEDGTPAEGKADIIIAKHRNGGLADVRLRFIARQAKFCDLETFEEAGNAPFVYGDDTESTNGTITRPSRINDISSFSLPEHMPF